MYNTSTGAIGLAWPCPRAR